MFTLACSRCVSDGVRLLQDVPFLHSWFWLLMLWVGVSSACARSASLSAPPLPVSPGRYLVWGCAAALWGVCNGLDWLLNVPVLGLWVLRILVTGATAPAELWRTSPSYLAFHRGVAWSAVLLVPGSYLRYWAQGAGGLLPYEGLVGWLLSLGVVLLVTSFVVAHRHPRLLGQPPAGCESVVPQRPTRGGGHQLVAVAPGQHCPLCHTDLDGLSLAICPGCDTLAHRACAKEFGGCGTLGCGHRPRRRTRGEIRLEPQRKGLRLADAVVLVRSLRPNQAGRTRRSGWCSCPCAGW